MSRESSTKTPSDTQTGTPRSTLVGKLDRERRGREMARDDALRFSPSPLAERIGAVGLLILALAYGVGAGHIDYAFASDPLGPRAMPLSLGLILGVLCLLYLRRPGSAKPFPTGLLLLRILAVPAIIVVTVFLLDLVGFAAAVFILTASLGLLFGAPLRLTLVAALGHAVLWWFIFVHLLDVYLPRGAVFG
ncbi:MAG: tripartite tricarboxylate transporter TctB family protein [Hyphomicrobiales bacterium]